MSFYFNFTTLYNLSQLKSLVDFMASQDLDYPGYEKWLQKTESQLKNEEKEAILAFSEGRLIGNLVHQTCRDNGLGMLREIKNARLHPELRDRHFMTFMLRQLYKEYEESVGVIVDVRANQQKTLQYFLNEGFIPIAKTALYENSMEETTLFKPLTAEASELIPSVKKTILAKSIH